MAVSAKVVFTFIFGDQFRYWLVVYLQEFVWFSAEIEINQKYNNTLIISSEIQLSKKTKGCNNERVR